MDAFALKYGLDLREIPRSQCYCNLAKRSAVD